jgi:hypothetical protein
MFPASILVMVPVSVVLMVVMLGVGALSNDGNE